MDLYVELRDGDKPLYRIPLSACEVTRATHGGLRVAVPQLVADEAFTVTKCCIVAKVKEKYEPISTFPVGANAQIRVGESLTLGPLFLTTV